MTDFQSLSWATWATIWFDTDLIALQWRRKMDLNHRPPGPEKGGIRHLSAASGVAHGTTRPFTLLLNSTEAAGHRVGCVSRSLASKIPLRFTTIRNRHLPIKEKQTVRAGKPPITSAPESPDEGHEESEPLLKSIETKSLEARRNFSRIAITTVGHRVRDVTGFHSVLELRLPET